MGRFFSKVCPLKLDDHGDYSVMIDWNTLSINRHFSSGKLRELHILTVVCDTPLFCVDLCRVLSIAGKYGLIRRNRQPSHTPTEPS